MGGAWRQAGPDLRRERRRTGAGLLAGRATASSRPSWRSRPRCAAAARRWTSAARRTSAVLERMGVLDRLREVQTGGSPMTFVDEHGRTVLHLPADFAGGDVEVLRADLSRVLYEHGSDAGGLRLRRLDRRARPRRPTVSTSRSRPARSARSTWSSARTGSTRGCARWPSGRRSGSSATSATTSRAGTCPRPRRPAGLGELQRAGHGSSSDRRRPGPARARSWRSRRRALRLRPARRGRAAASCCADAFARDGVGDAPAAGGAGARDGAVLRLDQPGATSGRGHGAGSRWSGTRPAAPPSAGWARAPPSSARTCSRASWPRPAATTRRRSGATRTACATTPDGARRAATARASSWRLGERVRPAHAQRPAGQPVPARPDAEGGQGHHEQDRPARLRPRRRVADPILSGGWPMVASHGSADDHRAPCSQASAVALASGRLQAVPAALPLPRRRPAAREADQGAGARHGGARGAGGPVRAARRRTGAGDRAGAGRPGVGAGACRAAGVRRAVRRGRSGAGASGSASAEELLDGYFGLEDPRRFDADARELLVESELPSGVLLRGYIDRRGRGADRRDPGGRLQDRGRAARGRRGQGAVPDEVLRAGAVAAARRGAAPAAADVPGRPAGAGLPAGRGGAGRFERTLEAIWDAILRAAKSGDFRPNPSRLCDYCDHKALCPAFDGTPPPYPGWPEPDAGVETALDRAD